MTNSGRIRRQNRQAPSARTQSQFRTTSVIIFRISVTIPALLPYWAVLSRPSPKTGSKRCRLLYVEHDAESLLHVEQLVAARKDVQLLRAANLHLAVELARRRRIDVILIDIDLPDFDLARSPGEIVRRLHADRAIESIPILALSNNAAPAAIMRGLEAGFFQYLTKPIHASAFSEALAFAREFVAIDRAEQAGVQPRAAKQPLRESR